MRMPRDVSGEELAKLLKRYRCKITRQTGSHLRLTTDIKGEYHFTIPNHNPIKIGTLNGILTDMAKYLNVDKQTVIKDLFGGVK